MTTLLLCNIGNSDLVADQDTQPPRPARVVGKTLWETYSEHTFAIPIIRPYLEYFQRKNIVIERCILFDTDQRDTVANNQLDRYKVKLRDKDTLWFGAIIERLLREHWSSVIHTVERRTITRINPSLYDDAIDEYGRQLSEIDDGTVTQCYLLTAGGIQACNTALLLKSISRFGERCESLYQPEGGEPYKLRVGQQVLATFRQATVIELLTKHDFAGALTIFPTKASEGLRELVQYARDREAFDFEQAQASLEKAESLASGEIREFVRTLRDSLNDLINREQIGALMLELVENATIAFNNGRYTDFLGRMFRFQEATLRYMVEHIYGISTDIDKKKGDQNIRIFQAAINQNPGLLHMMQQTKIGKNALRFDEPNMPTLGKMIEYVIDGGVRADSSPYLKQSDRGVYRSVLERVNKFGKLSQLRNQSIIAHGFQGISLPKIKAAYGDGDPMADMRTIIKQLQMTTNEQSLFERISIFVVEQLRRSA